MTTESFTKLLQLSLSPIAVISGAGLLLLSITNRLKSTIDRARQLSVETEIESNQNKAEIRQQLQILVKRAEFLRISAFCTGFSVFLSTLMMLGLFLCLFLEWSMEGWVLLFLFASVGCLCLSMVFFILDVSLSLKAVKIELRKYLSPAES